MMVLKYEPRFDWLVEGEVSSEGINLHYKIEG